MSIAPTAKKAIPYKEKSNEVLHKELELIQNCIGKYDSRSMLIRGWSVALITLICGLTASDILFFDPDLKPVSLLLLITVNWGFRLVDIDNSKKKFLYTELYNWTIRNRNFDQNEWEHVYDLNYNRFKEQLRYFEPSAFGQKLYQVTWGFILCLMIWYTIQGMSKSKQEKVPAKTTETKNK